MAVARSSGRVTKSQGEGWQIWGFSSQLTMHCNAFAAKGINREGGDGGAQRGRSVIYAIALTMQHVQVFRGVCLVFWSVELVLHIALQAAVDSS